jgi:hypothetical protein
MLSMILSTLKLLLPTRFQVFLLRAVLQSTILRTYWVPPRWRFNPTSIMDKNRNYKVIEVYISLVKFDFAFIQRPQQMAIHSANLDTDRKVIFVETTSFFTKPRSIEVGKSSVTILSLPDWKILMKSTQKYGHVMRLFLPAHSANLSSSWLPPKKYWGAGIQIVADLFDLPSATLDGRTFGRKRAKLQKTLLGDQRVKWFFCSDFLNEYLVSVEKDRKLYLPNASPTKLTHEFSELICDPSFGYSKKGKELDDLIFTLSTNSKDVAVFSGVFGSWIDRDFIEKLISSFPEWKFIIIGPKYLDDLPIFRYSNVTQFESMPYFYVTKLLQVATIGILPFDESDVSKAASPLKLYEYLEHGLVVLTGNSSLKINARCVLLKKTDDSQEIKAKIISARDAEVLKPESWFDLVHTTDEFLLKKQL